MPINEINAPVYMKIKYITPAWAAGHWVRAYFATGSSWVGGTTGDEDNWRLQVGGSPVANVKLIVDTIFARLANVIPSGTELETIELWASAAGSNILQHLNPLPALGDYGSASQVAASYYTEVFTGALREQFRFTVFDGTNARPQRSAATPPPDTDDDSLEWYFLKSDIPFATNDGVRLTTAKSINIGYNRKLARSYGRSVSP